MLVFRKEFEAMKEKREEVVYTNEDRQIPA